MELELLWAFAIIAYLHWHNWTRKEESMIPKIIETPKEPKTLPPSPAADTLPEFVAELRDPELTAVLFDEGPSS